MIITYTQNAARKVLKDMNPPLFHYIPIIIRNCSTFFISIIQRQCMHKKIKMNSLSVNLSQSASQLTIPKRIIAVTNIYYQFVFTTLDTFLLLSSVSLFFHLLEKLLSILTYVRECINVFILFNKFTIYFISTCLREIFIEKKKIDRQTIESTAG